MSFFKNPENLKKICLFALALSILILGTVTVFRAALFEVSRTDLTVYLRAAEAIHNHENIYHAENLRHWHYVYLPLLAILMTPVTSLPLWLNAALWYLISMAALIGTFLGLQSLFPGTGFISNRKTSGQSKFTNISESTSNGHKSFWIVLCALILALPPLLNTFTRGQLGAVSLYLTLLVFILDYRGKKFSAGLILGFAIILKMSPLLILPFYFILHRNWRVLLGCLLGALFFGILFPSLVLTPQLNWQYLLEYFKILSESSGASGWKHYLWEELFTPFASDNQSFYAVATRLFWKSREAFMNHSNTLIRSLNFGLLLVLLSLVTWAVARGKNFSTFRFSDFKNKTMVPTARFTEYSLLSMVMLFTSPVTQPHHYTPLMLLGTAAFLNMETHPSFKKILLGSMAICLLFFTLGILIEPLAEIGLPFWGSLLLWLAVLSTRFKTT